MTPLLSATFALALAAAPAGKLAVIDVDAPPTMIGLGSQVTRALSDAAAKAKLLVISPQELRTALGPKKYDELVACAGKPACVAQGLTDVPGVTRAVSGSLNRDEKNYLLKLALIDLKSLAVIADVDRSTLIASRRFQRDVEQLAGPLLRGEREARGKLVVTTTVKNAQVSINGEFVGVAPVTIQLKPGKHEVKVERSKYLPVTRLVDIEADKTLTEDVRLLLTPGERPDEDELPALVVKPAEKPETAGFHLGVPTMISGGAAIAALGVGLVFGIQVSSTEKRLLSGYDAATDSYAGTRADALAARSNATIANVCYGVAGAALAATVVFLVLDIRSGNEAVQVTPTAGPGGAGVWIGGSF